MKQKIFFSGVLTLLFMGVMFVPTTQAQSQSVVEQIQALMAQLEELQKKLAQLRGEVREVIKDGLREGATDEDIKKVQEILATDPSIYPQGLVTGYFGPLTRDALKRFQERHKIAVTGELDTETREWFEAYLTERHGERIPPGLLSAPGIMKKVETRFAEGCDNDSRKASGPLCKKVKERGEKPEKEDKEEDGDDDSEDEEDEEGPEEEND